MTNHEIVFTGFGMLTSYGCGIDENIKALSEENKRSVATEYLVRGFNPLPFLSDKKMVKVVSARDVLGLVAFETCQKNADLKKENINPERTGLYVGAPSSACADNLNYAEAVEASRDTYGKVIESEFGTKFVHASPTTLLVGLPNNVLCYGSKIMDARGANSNYTALELSGHVALINGARAMRLGRVDCAMVGGYSGHSDEVFLASLKQRGLLKSASAQPQQISPNEGTIIAEGAVFTAMETRENAEKRKAKVFATYIAGALASDARGPFKSDAKNPVAFDLMEKVIDQAGIFKEEIGAVMLTASGITEVDNIEKNAIQKIFEDTKSKPILGTTSGIWGNLMEAGGLAEIAVLAKAYNDTKLPEGALLERNQNTWKENSPYALILRSTPWGEYSAVLIRCEKIGKNHV